MPAIAQTLQRPFGNSESFGWVLLQQLLTRAVLATKFLLAARLLGPEAVGMAGIAILALTIAEALSDTGLGAALVQSPYPMTARARKFAKQREVIYSYVGK